MNILLMHTVLIILRCHVVTLTEVQMNCDGYRQKQHYRQFKFVFCQVCNYGMGGLSSEAALLPK